MAKKFMTHQVTILLMVMFTAPTVLFANSRFNNNDIYEVVIADSNAGETAKPGVYRINRKTGESEPILYGEIPNVNRATKGIHTFISINRQTSMTAAAIVNGRVTLINYNSRSDNPKSVIKLGDDKSGPVVDILTGRALQIPLISDASQVTILEANQYNDGFPKGAQLLFVSIKAPTIHGTGVTFAVLVHGSGAQDKVSIQNGQATLIAHDYLDTNQLQRLIATNAPAGFPVIFAPAQIESVKAQLKNESASSPVIAKWSQQLDRFLKYIMTGKTPTVANARTINSQTLRTGVPQYDLLNTRQLSTELPVAIIGQDKNGQDYGVFGQVFDPYTRRFTLIESQHVRMNRVELGTTSFYFADRNDFQAHSFYEGQILADKNGKDLIFGIFNAPPAGGRETGDSYDSTDFSNSFLFVDSTGSTQLAIKNQDGRIGIYRTQLSYRQGDRIHILNAGEIVEANRTLRTYLLSVQSATAKTSKIYSFIFEMSHSPRLLATNTVYEGPAMTPYEIHLRLKKDEHDILFDDITPVAGATAYKKVRAAEKKQAEAAAKRNGEEVELVKTVPYRRLLQRVMGQNHPYGNFPQRYLRPLIDNQLTINLHYRYFDPKGAQMNASGFYLSRGKNIRDVVFFPGRPLFFAPKKSGDGQKEITHISDSIDIEPNSTFGLNINLKVHLIPYSETMNPEKGRELSGSEFNIGISTNSSNESGSVNGTFEKVQIRYPFQSLAFTKIIRGIKTRKNEFHVLLFFKQDPSIKGSQDAVVAFTGRVRVDKGDNNSSNTVLTMSDAKILHRGTVAPEEIKAHVRENAEGEFFWVVDPSLAPESSRFAARKISAPEERIEQQRGFALSLRESESMKDNHVGQVGSYKMRVGGKWVVYSDYGLKERVPRAREVIETDEKLKKSTGKGTGKGDKDASEEIVADPKKRTADTLAEKQFYDAFSNHLNALAGQTGPGTQRVEVILVESTMKQKFRDQMLRLLASDKSSGFSLTNRSFNFLYANSSAHDDVEIGEEFIGMKMANSNLSQILFVEPESLDGSAITVRQKVSKEDQDDEYDQWSEGYTPKETAATPADIFKYDTPDEAGNFAVMLATGGQAKTVKGFRRVSAQATQVPTVIIASPDEWREIQNRNEKEFENGVFDKFHLNFNFLTAPWSLWPPGTEKSPADVKAIAKSPYNVEEMRVFPSLDRILTEAASGQLKGRQKILIVPPELLPIINKLILLRWATSDINSAGEWNQLNRRLALFRLSASDATQAHVQDNFKAIRGAASSRNSVLYGDLESVLRIGRPTNATGRNFTLRDPFRTTKSLIIDQAESIVDQADVAAIQLSEDEEAEVAQLREEIQTYQSQLDDSQNDLSDTKARKSEMEKTEYDEEIKRINEEISSSTASIRETEARISQIESPGDNSSSADTKNYPNMMYWIATEGQSIQPKRGKDWKLKDDTNLNAATLLIGTQDQLAQLEANMTYESRFFKLSDQFEIEHLLPPSDETKIALITQLFDRPEVAALNIKFQLKDGNPRDPRSQLIHQFINRVDQLAYDQKMEKTTAFVKAFIVLRQSLSEDLDLRRTRLIDQNYIERLFTRVFPMPLDPEILEPSDYLNSIRNIDQASRNLQKSGYEGSQDLKRRFFETVLSQTRSTDPSRPIPNSQILFGSTSTGKTFLLRTFFKMANMVEYNPNRPNNEDADYILFSVGDITADKNAEPTKFTVEEVIANVMDLLSQRKGARAHIVIDDFHKASNSEIRQKLFRFIMSISEAKGGMLTVQSKDRRKTKEIPIQNISLYMTLNPTSNEAMRSKYVVPGTKYSQAELLKREVLAALSDKDFQPEDSELARWADIINMDHFPRSAKVPELGRRVREYARNNSSQGMVLVSPSVIDSLVEQFASANARELLAPAASALTSIPPSAKRAKVYTVTLRKAIDIGDAMFPHSHGSGAPGAQVNLTELQGAVRKMTQVDAVTMDDPRSLLRFMSFLLQNFRLQVLNGMSLEAHMTDLLRIDIPGQISAVKSNYLIASSIHVLDNPTLPVGELLIRPDQLTFFTRGQQDEFFRHFKAEHSTGYFPEGFGLRDDNLQLDLNNFINGKVSAVEMPNTRKAVVLDFIERARQQLSRALVLYLRLNSTSELKDISRWSEPQIRQWFSNLKEQNPDGEFKAIMHDLLELYLEFSVAFNSPDLDDMKNPAAGSLTLYDQVRLFDYVIDKAITELPWGNVAKLTYDIVDMSSDYSLGTKTSYKEYVGAHSISPFAVTTPEFMNEMLDVGFNYQTASKTIDRDARRADLKKGFDQACEILLRGAK